MQVAFALAIGVNEEAGMAGRLASRGGDDDGAEHKGADAIGVARYRSTCAFDVLFALLGRYFT